MKPWAMVKLDVQGDWAYSYVELLTNLAQQEVSHRGVASCPFLYGPDKALAAFSLRESHSGQQFDADW